MRKTNDKTLKEAFEQMLQVYKIKKRYEETGIKANWSDLVGPAVANRTKEIYIYNKRLYLRIESSVIKNELVLMRNQIIEKVNERAKEVLVEEIIFL
jgi:predicted nucleic acid-binding Zn ribbon protein